MNILKKLKLPFVIDKTLSEKFSQVFAFAEIKLINPDGSIAHKHKQVIHSLNANFLMAFYAGFNEYTTAANYGFTAPFTTNHSVIDLTNVNVQPASTNILSSKGDTNNSNTGIVVGTGVPTVAPLTYNLTSKITSGVGAGQLSYVQQSSALGVTVLANDSSLVVTRTFINNSGAPITVKEFGIQACVASPYLYLVDPISPATTVNALQTLSIAVTFKITT